MKYSIQQHFESKLLRLPEVGCWLWLDALDPDGYGELKYNYKKYKAHRLSWILHKGEIPNQLCILHHCDVPSCVNPYHLFTGTFDDNNQDMVRKKRHAFGKRNGNHIHVEKRPRGIKHGMAKLTEEQVRNIRADPRSQRKIAIAYGLAQVTVGQIKRMEVWKHVT